MAPNPLEGAQVAEEQKKRQERSNVRDREGEEELNVEPERPLTRLRRNQQGQASQSVGNPSSMPIGTLSKQPEEDSSQPDLEDTEESDTLSCPPLVRNKRKQPMFPVPSSDAAVRTLALSTNGMGSGMVSPTTHHREKGKEPISSQSPASSTPAAGLNESGSILLPKQLAENSNAILQLAVPVAGIYPDGVQSDGGLDALDVTEKANNLDNESYNSENVHEVVQPPVPMHPPSFNENDRSKTLKDKGKRISEVDSEKESNDLEHYNSYDLVVQQHQTTPNGGMPFPDVVDIDRIVISCVNEVNDEAPPSFHYIPQNIVFQNAYVNFSLHGIGENCFSTWSDDCLSSPTPCACAHETGVEYAYTSEGLVKEDILKESVSMNRDPDNDRKFYCNDCPLKRKNGGVVEPCQGHLMRRFIKECWWKCGCDNQCGNRVVQRGINRKLQVFMTPEGKGWGLRTLEDLPEGAFVCEYVGEILTNAELFERVSQRKANGEVPAYHVLLDADWRAEGILKDEEALCLDATNCGNVGRFINHRCVDSNMVEIPVEVETPDHHYYHLAFFTTREVKALEELTWDYGIDFDIKDHPVKAFKCRCGSKLCRNMKRNASIPEHFLHKNRLQQYVQKLSLPPPTYQTHNVGAQHAPMFSATVSVGGTWYTSANVFKKVKFAEQDIAKIALDALTANAEVREKFLGGGTSSSKKRRLRAKRNRTPRLR